MSLGNRLEARGGSPPGYGGARTARVSDDEAGRTVNFFAQTLVVGIATPAGLVPGATGPGFGEVTIDRLNRIWSELAPVYGYRSLQLSPEGNAGQLIGSAPGDHVTIQPPLLQVRDSVPMTAEQAADKTQAVLKVVARHLQASQFVQLGVKWIYHADAPGRDARRFMLGMAAPTAERELEGLSLGGDYFVGMKYVTRSPEQDKAYTVVVEPLIADPAKLFIDLDAQHGGGLIELDRIKSAALDVHQYAVGSIAGYLETLAQGGVNP